MELGIEFFSDEKGKRPVEKFLREVFRRNRKLWAQTISGLNRLKQRVYHKAPLSKNVGKGLWEARIQSGNNILRIIYTFAGGRKIVLLHGFIKKNQKTPKKELTIAKQRKRQLENYEKETK